MATTFHVCLQVHACSPINNTFFGGMNWARALPLMSIDLVRVKNRISGTPAPGGKASQPSNNDEEEDQRPGSAQGS